MLDRRTFIKSLAALGVAGVMPQSLKAGVGLGDEAMPLLAVNNNALRITGTFLDEISHDIPHQNWGEKEWDADFRYMKAIGIDTVIMIRCGYRKFITYPSAYLVEKGLNSKMQILMMQKGLSDRSAIHVIDKLIFHNTRMIEDKNVLYSILRKRKDEIIEKLEKEGLPKISLNHVREYLQ